MKIGIINNASNYLDFNVNLGRYLECFGNEVFFLNGDKYIKNRLHKYELKTVDYKKTKTKIDKYNLDSKIVQYLKRLYNLKTSKTLIHKLNSDYNKALAYFKQNTYDYVLILNGSFNVETDVCKELGIKCFFFEHGYFPKTVQMDAKGVNSESSFAKLNFEEFMSYQYRQNPINPLKDFEIVKVKQSLALRYFYRLLDKEYYAKLTKVLERKRKNDLAAKRFKKFEMEQIDFEKMKPFIFFPLQVNSDTQIILNSPYSSMYEAIEDVLPKLKETSYNIIIKEHPMEVEPVDYSQIVDNKQVFLTTKTDLDALMEHCEFTVNINSSVGLQAIAKHSKVLTLGECFYNNAPNVLRFKDVRDKKLASEFDKLNLDLQKNDRYIEHFKNDIFISNHFYTPNIDLLESVRSRLV